MNLSECKSCHKKIMWIKTTAGKPTPVDPCPKTVYPSPTGRHVVYLTDGKVIRADLEDNGHEAKIGYTSHFATCDQKKITQLRQQAATREKEKLKAASPEQSLF